MKHIAYYQYDDAPEKIISEEQVLLLKLSGYMPHPDRVNDTPHLFYPIPEDEKEVWDSLKEETA